MVTMEETGELSAPQNIASPPMSLKKKKSLNVVLFKEKTERVGRWAGVWKENGQSMNVHVLFCKRMPCTVFVLRQFI